MFSLMKNAIVILCASIMFVGCASVKQKPPVVTNLKESQKPVTIKFNTKYMSKHDKNIFKYQIIPAFYSSSKYPRYKKEFSSASNHVDGVRLVKNKTDLVIDYVYGNISENSSRRYEYVSKVVFKCPILEDTQDENSYTLKIKYPTSYTVSTHTGRLGDFDFVDPVDKLKKDAQHIYDNLVNSEMKYTHKFTGEVNTKYPSDAIYANFQRLSGVYNRRQNTWWSDSQSNVSGHDIKKGNVFTLKYNGKAYPLKIDVYPYRDGSKVVYKSFVDYTINGKNEASLNDEIMKNIRQAITKIINN